MHKLCFLLLAALLIAGCAESPTSSTSSVIMPLKVGNQWIGRVTLDSAGTTVVSYDTLTIVQEVVINNETWYEANTGIRYINRADGLRSSEILFPDPNCPDSGAALSYPSACGDKSLMPESVILLPGHTDPVVQIIGREVMATDSTVTVPAGSFSCYHYRVRMYSPKDWAVSPDERFYKPDLGPVLILSKGRRWELVKATVN